MQFDRTRIVIRERNWNDLIDLTFVVIREYAKPILVWGVLSAIPFALLNALVLAKMLDTDWILLESSFGATEEWLYVRYFWSMTCLVCLEAPFAMQALTYFLGQAVFVDRPSFQDVLKQVRFSLFNCILILGILRGGLLGLPILFFVPSKTSFEPVLELLMLGAVILLALIARVFRPYAPEMLMLERSKLRKPPKSEGISYAARSRSLHLPIASDLFGRALFLAFVNVAGFISLYLSEKFCIGVLLGYWNFGWWDTWILFPLNLWILVIMSTVFRFLAYLDSRIRLEGWEVELRLRAEALRLEPSP